MNEEKRRYLTDESARRMARPVVTVLLFVGLGLGYWVWPSGITDKALAEVPLSDLLQAAASLLVGLVTLGIVVRAWLDI